MKLCKDCVHFIPGVFFHGGSLLPGFAYSCEPLCGHPSGAREALDLVEGNHRAINMDCKFNREHEDACGQKGSWFEPATLDGRLAMLEDKSGNE